MKYCLSLCLLILSPSLSLAAPTAFEQVKSQIKLTEGAYDLRSKDPSCEEGLVDVELVGDDENVTLRIGQKVTFVHLQKPNVQNKAELGCTFDYTTKFGDNEIIQVTKFQCPQNKSAGYVHSQKIQFAGADITYTSKTEGATSKQQTCQYAFAPEKKGKR